MMTVTLAGGGTITGAPRTLVTILQQSGTVRDAPTFSGDGAQRQAADYLRALEAQKLLTIQESA